MRKFLVLLVFALSTLVCFSQVRISEQGKEFIKQQESCVLTAYWDTDGYSIGYGHHGKGVYKDMVITQKQADDFFKKDIALFEQYVQDMIDDLPYKCTFSQGFIDGFISFTYNVGPGNARRSIFYQRLKNCRVKNGIINENDFEYAVAGIKLSIIRCAVHKQRRAGEYKLMKLEPDLRNVEGTQT
jgi:GH24 family phage-related lysozyme (muramidase)